MKINFKNIWNLIKVANKSSAIPKKNKSTAQAMGYFAVVLFGGLLGFVCFSLYEKLGLDSFKGLLSLLCLGFQFFLLSYAITDLYKLLFLNTDKEILAYLPVNKQEIYLSKVIYSYLKMLTVFICLAVPTYIVYGALSGAAIWFYFSIIFVLLLLPILPFGLANLLVIPVIYLVIWLKHKLIVKLIIMSVITVLVFFVYNNIVFEIANILLLDTTSANLIVSIADKLANALLPFGIFARFMVVDRIVNSILVIILVSGVSIFVGLTVGMFGYKTAFQMLLADKNNSKIIETKIKQETPFKAFLMYELKSLFRNSTYLFVYFVMSLAMPIMVMLCNGFILEFAVNKVGSTVVFGVTLFVIMCFVSIICSPTASFISKEGEQFWIIKTNPHGIKYPLIAKSVVGVVCAGCSLLATLLAVCIKGYVNVAHSAIILAIALMFIVGLVALGININLLRPTLFKTNTENSSNMAIHILASFILAIIIGVLGILGVFIFSFITILLIVILLVLLFTIINVVFLLLFSEKLYQQMEVK